MPRFLLLRNFISAKFWGEGEPELGMDTTSATPQNNGGPTWITFKPVKPTSLISLQIICPRIVYNFT